MKPKHINDLALGIVLICLFMSVIAIAQDVPAGPEGNPVLESPAFQVHQGALYRIESDVIDVAKLEARAITIMRARAPGMTLAQAREKLRVYGHTDIAACMNLLIDDALSKITQAVVKVTSVSNQDQHPQELQPVD